MLAAHVLGCARHSVVQVAPVGARVHRVGLDPGQVEEVVHEPREAGGLGPQDRQELAAVVIGERPRTERSRRRGDRRER